MTYTTYGRADLIVDDEQRRSADFMALFFAGAAAIWIVGAALMFTAAYKGSTLSSATATVSDSIGAAPADAPATPASAIDGGG